VFEAESKRYKDILDEGYKKQELIKEGNL